MPDFRAVLIRKDGDTQHAELTQLAPTELMDGDVTVAVSHSAVNYKDGMALTGGSPVVRRFPMSRGMWREILAGKVRGRLVIDMSR